SYLIVDFHEKTFCLVTEGQYKILRDGYISTLPLTSKTRTVSSETFASLLERLNADSSSLITYRGWLLACRMTTKERNLIDSLRNLNFSQKNCVSVLSKSLT